MQKKLFILFIFGVYPVFTYAQKSLSELVVTANKYPQKQTQSGKVLTVLPDSVLRLYQGQTLGQILNQQCGLYVLGSTQSPGSIQSISIRGSAFGQTLILIDGTPIQEPSGIGNSFDINLLNITNIERVEILKSGQSTLYGSDALGGTINIITRKISSEKTGISADISADNLSSFNGNIALQSHFKKTQYVINQSVGISKGVSSSLEKNNSENFEKDGTQYANTNLKVNQLLDSRNSIYGLVRLNLYKSDLDLGTFLDDSDYDFKTVNIQIGTGGEHTFEKGKTTWKHLFSKINRKYTNDSSDVNPTAYSLFSSSRYLSLSNFTEVYHNQQITNKLHVLIGSDFRQQQMEYNYFSISSTSKFEGTPIKPKDAKAWNWSAYVNATLNFKNGLGLEWGSRLNMHSQYNTNATYTINPFFYLKNKWKVFGTLSSSYKNPVLYELFSEYGNKDLLPEKSTNWELGNQMFFKNTQNYIRLVGFKRKYTDLITFVSMKKAPYGQYQNLHKATNKGFEVDATYWIYKVQLNGNYTFLDGVLYSPSKNLDAVARFLRRPKNQFNISAQYFINTKMSVGLDFQNVGQRNDVFYNTETFKSEYTLLKAYTLINSRFKYNFSKNSYVNLLFQNISNSKYQELYGYRSKFFTAQITIGFHI